MPPVRTARNRKPPPDGFEDLEDTLLEFSNKLKDAENAPHEGKKRHEVLWPVFQINHQRTSVLIPAAIREWIQGLRLTFSRSGSRYIYDLYYEKEAISKQLYDYLIKKGYANADLIAKWKKQGYEKVSTAEATIFVETMGTKYLIAVLPSLHPNQRDQLQRNLHL